MAPRTTRAEPLAAAEDALRRGDWTVAGDAYRAALDVEESAAAWEGLAWAAWWLCDGDLHLDANERAYRLYRAAGDRCAAGRMSAWLSTSYLEFRGEDARARGWLERAHRLLDGQPRCADHGWLAVNEGSLVMGLEDDIDRAGRLAVEAAEIGRDHGVPDLEAIGLALEGIVLVRRGQVERGMRQLDEAAAIAAGEELQLPISFGWSLCYLISACEGVGDLPRASQWCRTMFEHGERWGGRQMLGVCRSAYGSVLATGGDWKGAEDALTLAVEDLRASRPAMAAGGLARLGELRARQGRADEARELFERAGPHRIAIVGLGALALEGGDAAAAADAAERVLRRLPDDAALDRLPALELLARARVRQGDLDAAADACAQVRHAGELLGTPYVTGRAKLVCGELAAARGDHEEARRCCEDAVDCLTEASAVYDAALARTELASALTALGREEAAAAEAETAAAMLRRLGAERDAKRAARAAPGGRAVGAAAAGQAGNAADDTEAGDAELTARELEVLRLVAQGLGDAEIAERLVLSQHTVHRHVANVRAKLRQPSRAAAVAHAARAGLL
jgi:DNA-binding CsgD family transcriptional regulator